MEKVYIGIDLGTTNTLVSYFKKGKPALFKFSGHTVLPSVYFADPETAEVTIGDAAVAYSESYPDNCIRSSKRAIASDMVYRLETAKGTLELTPTDVATEILRTVKDKVVSKLNLTENDEIYALITVPAGFSGPQKAATIEAGENAGLKVLGVKPEPVAAAVDVVKNLGKNSMVMVVDVGGGTTDTAIVSVTDKLASEVIAQGCNPWLGGDDFDRKLAAYVEEQMKQYFGTDIFDSMNQDDRNQLAFRIKNAAICAKEALSIDEEAALRVKLPECFRRSGEEEFYSIKIKRTVFNQLCEDEYALIEKKMEETLKNFEGKGYRRDMITDLVLVGGSCEIPEIIARCSKKLGLPVTMCEDKTAAVAKGAAQIANNWTILGEALGGIVAQSMGIAVSGEKLYKLIKKDESYPTTREHTFTTTYDGQETVDVRIFYAGLGKEHIDRLSEHMYYGHFSLDGIKKAKAGTPKIKVTFDFDSNEQLTVTAKDMETGNSKTYKVEKDFVSAEGGMSRPMAIDLLIDVSGSMKGRDLKEAQAACRKMVNDIADLNVNVVGLTVFSTHAKSLCPLTKDKNKLLNGINSMCVQASTRIDNGLIESTKKLIESEYEDKVIFLMTDGDPDHDDNSRAVAADIRKKGIRLAVIFIGSKNSSGYNEAQKIAFCNTINGEEPYFYTAETMDKLSSIFRKVYADLTSVD